MKKRPKQQPHVHSIQLVPDASNGATLYMPSGQKYSISIEADEFSQQNREELQDIEGCLHLYLEQYRLVHK